jgi:hypothetical protein
MEIDIDDEVENTKISYVNQFKFLDEYAKRLTITVITKAFFKHLSFHLIPGGYSSEAV